jgi:hypothetical protein
MSKKWKWTLVSLGAIVVAVFVGLSIMAGSPKDAYGMVRYAFPHMHRSRLHPGDDAPDAQVLALDGRERFHLRERMQQRPLVLIFGSYT